jgi:hypothetical protein
MNAAITGLDILSLVLVKTGVLFSGGAWKQTLAVVSRGMGAVAAL